MGSSQKHPDGGPRTNALRAAQKNQGAEPVSHAPSRLFINIAAENANLIFRDGAVASNLSGGRNPLFWRSRRIRRAKLPGAAWLDVVNCGG